ncbi:response regulator transcription factor [Parvimonas micra]|uniref:response regulator transcription factor n=1 Tax=Parvimonas micra TaxID=33033 RepID=UPI0012389A39|nr:response regulator transcription factor [Parvimonas micra]MCK6130797.1 response regulator transcription factor [Parvimonas micra]MCK6136442.1 response regulator transcription factor [Parvimonas micra]MCK6137913.1 response regulator transcription factor [Parvimonas micra]MCK6154441.1 response regulator transcription factor [Parvimonas micra]MCZ7408897.1 response regulator transcription factor [Parvimonas micra]
MKILMVDDDLLVLNALSTILGKSGYEIVLATTDSKKAIETYKENKIDVVILDIRMKEVNGVDVAIEILEYDKDAKIMLLTTFNDRDDIIRALNKGVLGVILKDNVASLIPAIESVKLGNKILDNELKLQSLFNTTKKDFENLTQKEIEIIEQIAKGLSNKEISEKLFLSEGTVRNYISGILEKLELRDRTQLAIYYYTK